MHPRKESTLHRFNPAWRTTLAALTATLAITLAHAAPSHAAGSYIHQSCLTASDIADSYGGWQPSGYSMSGVGNINECSSTGLTSTVAPLATIPLGASAGWTYTAPPNTMIARFVTRYTGWTKPYDNVNRGVLQVANAASAVGLTWTGTLDLWHPQGFDWTNLNTSSVTARILCDGPAGHAGCTGDTGWATLLTPKIVLSDDLPPAGGSTSGSLTTDTTLLGSEHLAYSASDAGGGVARLRLYVDGQPTAVDHVIDTNNGHCQVTGTENGAWTFPAPKPCPGSVNAEEAIDTTTIPDGQHTITAKVVDAAQREGTLWTGTRLVANHPPVNTQLPLYADQDPAVNPAVGKTITVVSDGTWTGPALNVSHAWAQCDGHGTLSTCAAIPGASTLSYKPTSDDVGHRLRLLVTATNPAASVTAASQPTGIVTSPSSAEPLTPKPPASDGGGSGDNGGGGGGGQVITVVVPPAPVLPPVSVSATVDHALRGRVAGEAPGVGCPQDKASLKFEHVTGGAMKLGFGRASTAQVLLTCTSNGKPIEGAQLDIATKVGSKAAVAADVTTDGAGHATLRLAKGASRAISIGYRMFADDPIARTTATLKVSVNGRISLTGNRRHLRNGQAVTLRGKLLGGEIPKRGVTLAVQWKDGKKWRPFAQIKTTRKGTFSYAYRFIRTSGKITYALRVQVTKGQVDYPYLPVAAKAVKVTVAS
jgi:hypothetical protein